MQVERGSEKAWLWGRFLTTSILLETAGSLEEVKRQQTEGILEFTDPAAGDLPDPVLERLGPLIVVEHVQKKKKALEVKAGWRKPAPEPGMESESDLDLDDSQCCTRVFKESMPGNPVTK